jgi:hypothetical protein
MFEAVRYIHELGAQNWSDHRRWNEPIAVDRQALEFPGFVRDFLTAEAHHFF